ncbi:MULTISPECIES: hypothetical protein [unclassified Nocardiopsis]|uniref:hypothetical protein n=1 Tax=unclassified Nocardiopsis TaxID=2649073 RepID=UPI000A451BF8|nr:MULTISPECIES: hypothetical protein [unclassified Nocardiopsis]MBQ1083551.1 hypothetical protein [Nocardiopsis sp. B62]
MVETEETDSKRGKPAKKGLHGWKAALAVFGCGTLAAFGVFGVIVGVLSLIIGTAATGVSESTKGESPIEMIGEPQASIDPGDLDLCSRNLSSSPQVNLTRSDSAEEYTDSVENGERRVRDRCEWKMVSEYNATQRWDLIYSYNAVIDSPEGDRVAVASAEFDDAVGGLGSDFDRVEDRGEAGFADRSEFVYGEVRPGVSGYVLLAQTRSAVYEIRLEAEGDSAEGDVLVPLIPMQKEAEKLVRISVIEFELWIPGRDD